MKAIWLLETVTLWWWVFQNDKTEKGAASLFKE